MPRTELKATRASLPVLLALLESRAAFASLLAEKSLWGQDPGPGTEKKLYGLSRGGRPATGVPPNARRAVLLLRRTSLDSSTSISVAAFRPRPGLSNPRAAEEEGADAWKTPA